MFFKTCFDVRFVCVKGVEFGHVFCKVVVEFGQFFDLNGVERYFENRFFSGKVFGIFFGEGNGDVFRFALLHAYDAFFKTGDKGFAAEFQIVIFACAAVEFNAADRAFEIDIADVAFFGFSVFFDFNDASRFVLCEQEFRLNLIVGNFKFFFCDFHALVFTEFDFGLDGDGNREFNRFVACFQNVRFGTADRLDRRFFFKGFFKVLGKNDVESVVQENVFAEFCFQHLAGHFAGTEAFKFIMTFVLVISFLDSRFYFGFVDFDCEFYLTFFKFFECVVHKTSK